MNDEMDLNHARTAMTRDRVATFLFDGICNTRIAKGLVTSWFAAARMAVLLLGVHAASTEAHFYVTAGPHVARMIGTIQPVSDEVAACSSESWKPPAEIGRGGVLALLRDVALGTRWADLPEDTKSQLWKLAGERLEAFRARWGAAALSHKESILLGCPTPEMITAIDEFYRKTYDKVVPGDFALRTIKSAQFRAALVSNYLGTVAGSRAFVHYPVGKLLNRDWDGRSPFDLVSLPDQQSYEDIRSFNAAVVRKLKEVDDASFEGVEKNLKQRVLFDARANAAGGGNFGDGDMESACHVIEADWAVLAGYQLDKKEYNKARPEIFATDDEVLSEVNAIYANNLKLKWLDIGTLNSAVNFCDFTGASNMIGSLVGDPKVDQVAKAMTLLKSWWIERLRDDSRARSECTIYSAEDRARIWEAFSASQLVDSDGSYPMSAYQQQLVDYANQSQVRYRKIAGLALERVFPDNSELKDDERRKVIRSIATETAFGLFPDRVRAALDAAQGTTGGPAASKWQASMTQYVARIGGQYDKGDLVRPDEEASLNSMFEEVKAWVAREYRGYPIDVSSLFSRITLVFNTQAGSPDTVYPGVIKLGLSTERSKLEYYSWLLHELRHAVRFAWQATASDKSTVQDDEGPNVEGAGVAAEALLLEPFARATLKSDTAYALYMLDYGIRDAKFAGTTDATLQKYFRSECSDGPARNTIEFTKRIAAGYGLTGDKAETAALRAHAGTQYLQYILGGLQVLDTISYLQNRLDPDGSHRVDPYVLFACGLNNPSRDEGYVSALKACMKL